ncbi:MAG: hypothetical protein ACXVCP_00480 [Bdellovibrio sp.]
MSNLVTTQPKSIMSLIDPVHAAAVEAALAMNDLSKLTTPQRVSFYNAVCESCGLNPITQPFAFIKLNGKDTLYTKKDATDQLRKLHGVSISIKNKETMNDIYIVHVEAKDKYGKTDESTGVVVIGGLRGVDLANALMKAETKAKRRVTLSICGLGFLDDSEMETVANVAPTENPQIANPFKKDEPKEVEAVEVESVEESLGDFVCKVGKKHTGKKLSDFDIFELNNFCENTKKWFEENNKKMSPDWIEFFEKAEAFLCSREVPQIDENEPLF